MDTKFMRGVEMNHLIGTTVSVYRNLNEGLLGIKVNGKVIGYCNSIELENCSVKVESGAASIKRTFETTGKKDRKVVAYIVGTLKSIDASNIDVTSGRGVSFNPLFATHFYYAGSERKEVFTSAKRVTFKVFPELGKKSPMKCMAI